MNAIKNLFIKVLLFPILSLPLLIIRDIPLLFKSRQSYSQHGEDLFVKKHFPAGHKGTYVEIGSSHPIRISNTYLFYKNGWSGVCVDPIPTYSILYKIYRKRDTFINGGVSNTRGKLRFFECFPRVLSSFDESYIRKMQAKGQLIIRSEKNDRCGTCR